MRNRGLLLTLEASKPIMEGGIWYGPTCYTGIWHTASHSEREPMMLCVLRSLKSGHGPTHKERCNLHKLGTFPWLLLPLLLCGVITFPTQMWGHTQIRPHKDHIALCYYCLGLPGEGRWNHSSRTHERIQSCSAEVLGANKRS